MADSIGKNSHETKPNPGVAFTRGVFETMERQPEFSLFLSNLKEFLKQAPQLGVLGRKSRINHLSTVRENLSELLRREPKIKSPDRLNSPLAAPIGPAGTAQFARVQSLSITMHVLLLTLLIAPVLPGLLDPSLSRRIVAVDPVDVARYFRAPAWMTQPGNKPGGASGERDLLPASVGTPPPLSNIQLVPPRVHAEEHIQTPIPPTLIGDPNLSTPRPNFANWGDPSSEFDNPSSGPGTHNGIGDGNDRGIGNGEGDSLGNGTRSGVGVTLGCPGCAGAGMPVCIYCPRADYTEEAVKAKYQGSVILAAIVSPDGRASDIHVSKGLGLGLDEKAVEAVHNWRFKPALGPDGKPVAMEVSIEVVFHLF